MQQNPCDAHQLLIQIARATH